MRFDKKSRRVKVPREVQRLKISINQSINQLPNHICPAVCIRAGHTSDRKRLQISLSSLPTIIQNPKLYLLQVFPPHSLSQLQKKVEIVLLASHYLGGAQTLSIRILPLFTDQ